MKLGINAAAFGKRLKINMDLVHHAEKLGFDSAWTAEAYGNDAVTAATWIAAKTETIKVGTAIMQMPGRSPAMTAMTAMSLDHLTGGRFILGLGPSGPHETQERRIAYATVKGTRAAAEKELRRRLTSLDKGVHVNPSALTVADYLDSWLADVAPASVAPKALERYRGLSRIQIKPHLGDKQLQKLRPADIAAWHQALGKTGISIRSIQHAHGDVSTPRTAIRSQKCAS